MARAEGGPRRPGRRRRHRAAPEIRARTSIILGKGTYLNGGNAIAVQRGLVVGQTIDLLRRLHPEHSEDYLRRLRRCCSRSCRRSGPTLSRG